QRGRSPLLRIAVVVERGDDESPGERRLVRRTGERRLVGVDDGAGDDPLRDADDTPGRRRPPVDREPDAIARPEPGLAVEYVAIDDDGTAVAGAEFAATGERRLQKGRSGGRPQDGERLAPAAVWAYAVRTLNRPRLRARHPGHSQRSPLE